MNKSDNLPTKLSKLIVLSPQKHKCRNPGDSRKLTVCLQSLETVKIIPAEWIYGTINGLHVHHSGKFLELGQTTLLAIIILLSAISDLIVLSAWVLQTFINDYSI